MTTSRTGAPATIDLGVYRYGAGPEPGSGPVWRHRVRRWRRLAVVPVVLLLGLVAGAAASPPPAVRLWTLPYHVDGRTMAMDGERLYAIGPAETGPTLAGYRLADGQVEWRILLGTSAEEAFVQLVPGALLVTTYDKHGAVTGYAPGTGARLWRRPGAGLVDQISGWALVTDRSASDGREVSAVDVRTGRVAGTVPAGEGEQVEVGWQAPDGSPHLLVLRDDGELTRYDLTTGREAARTRIAGAEQPESTQPGLRPSGDPTSVASVGYARSFLSTLGDMVTVGVHGPSPQTHAFDATTLAHRWTVGDTTGAMACGPVVCLYDDDHRWVVGVDPATGARRWSLSCDAVGAVAGCSLTPGLLMPPDRLWLDEVRIGREISVTSRAVDPATGAYLTDPTPWLPRDRSGDSTVLVSWAEHPGMVPSLGSPIWWTRIGPDLSAPRLLVAVQASGCDVNDPYLVCQAGRAGMEVWRLP